MPARPLDQHPSLAGREAAAVAAAVAGALADLHARGLVHGGVAPHRVLLDDEGVVSLLPADEPVPPARQAPDDLAAVGSLLAWLTERVPDRPARGPAGLLRVPDPAELLAELASRCRADDPDSRPSARLVADTLHRRLASAAGGPPPDRRRRPTARRRRRAALGSVAAVSMVGAVAVPGRCTASSAVPRADEQVRWADGLLSVGSRRYAVGAPGDEVAVDRWACGPSSVALLRRAAEDVVAFDRFPDAEPVVGRVVARVPGGRRLATRRTADGCPELAVVTADGRTVPVPWRKAS